MAETGACHRPRRRRRRPLSARAAGESGRGPGSRGAGPSCPPPAICPQARAGASPGSAARRAGASSALPPGHPPAVRAASPLLLWAEVRPDPQTRPRGVGVHPEGSAAVVRDPALERGREGRAWGPNLAAAPGTLCDLGQVSSPVRLQLTVQGSPNTCCSEWLR